MRCICIIHHSTAHCWPSALRRPPRTSRGPWRGLKRWALSLLLLLVARSLSLWWASGHRCGVWWPPPRLPRLVPLPPAHPGHPWRVIRHTASCDSCIIPPHHSHPAYPACCFWSEEFGELRKLPVVQCTSKLRCARTANSSLGIGVLSKLDPPAPAPSRAAERRSAREVSCPCPWCSMQCSATPSAAVPHERGLSQPGATQRRFDK
jgi:hypothetical protein